MLTYRCTQKQWGGRVLSLLQMVFAVGVAFVKTLLEAEPQNKAQLVRVKSIDH